MNKINFSIGPVMMHDNIKLIGKEDVPYFRTSEFSEIVFEIEKNLKTLTGFNEESKVLLLTGSGTFGMEFAMSNLLDKNDHLLIINGGTFGQRFVDIAEIYNYKYEEIKLEHGEELTRDKLKDSINKNITAILVNHHETSSGVVYDLDMIKEISVENNLILIVDAISSFIAEDINNLDNAISCLILGSQKGLSLPPGLSINIYNDKAVNKINKSKRKSLYLDAKIALDSATRGQTPFTPAVGIILQLNERLKALSGDNLISERNNIIELSSYFRNEITKLGYNMYINKPSNALTPIYFKRNAYEVFEILKDEFNIWVAPSGGELKDNLLRVGHLGNVHKKQYEELINALKIIKERGIL